MKKVLGVVYAFLFLATMAYAELAAGFQGGFIFDPIHKGPVTGVISLLFEGSTFSLVQVDLDKPILGQKTFLSKEHNMVSVDRPGLPSQISVIYKLERPPHKWYFVLIANATEQGNIFAGNFYKVPLTMEEILNLVKDGIDTIPDTWKHVGTTSLTKNASSITIVN